MVIPYGLRGSPYGPTRDDSQVRLKHKSLCRASTRPSAFVERVCDLQEEPLPPLDVLLGQQFIRSVRARGEGQSLGARGDWTVREVRRDLDFAYAAANVTKSAGTRIRAPSNGVMLARRVQRAAPEDAPRGV